MVDAGRRRRRSSAGLIGGLALCAGASLGSATLPAAAVERLAPAGTVTASAPRVHEGDWRIRVQMVWDPVAAKAVRRRYRLWDPFAAQMLDVRWVPADLSRDAEGNLSGSGELVWRKPGSSSHDASAIVAQYRGEMRDGMAHGEGRLIHNSGAVYEGAWARGLMEGRGRLSFPNGDQYVGEFLGGKRHGAGVLIDSTGAIYDGQFVADLREGSGVAYPIDSAAYRALWREDAEIGGTRVTLGPGEAPHFSRVQAQGPAGLALGVFVDRTASFHGADVLPYTFESAPDAVRIFPDDQRLMDVWRGRAEIQLTKEEESRSAEWQSFLRNDRARFQSLPLIFDLENTTTQRLGITGAYLQMIDSAVDADPAIHLLAPTLQGCEEPGFEPRITLENFGWGAANKARVRFAFADDASQSATKEMVKEIGSLAEFAHLDFTDALAAAGVDTTALAEAPVFCASRQEAVCLRQARATGIFGTVASSITMSGLTFLVPVKGTLEYTWFDTAKRVETPKTSPFSTKLPVGKLSSQSECGEGADPELIRPKPYKLSLDRKNYRITLPLTDDLPAGVTGRWRIYVEADKSSNHRFRIVFQLAGGQEIVSREVQLTYFKPKDVKYPENN